MTSVLYNTQAATSRHLNSIKKFHQPYYKTFTSHFEFSLLPYFTFIVSLFSVLSVTLLVTGESTAQLNRTVTPFISNRFF